MINYFAFMATDVTFEGLHFSSSIFYFLNLFEIRVAKRMKKSSERLEPILHHIMLTTVIK